MGSSAVNIIEVAVVTPSEPTPATVLPLSALDSQPFLRFTFEYLLIFKPHHHPHQNRASTAASLRSALARSLVPYYPLAGRVRPSPRGGYLLEVVCRAQGAVFIEAASDHVSANFEWAPRHVSHWRRLLSLSVPDVLQGAPALVVQLTWLRDGNAALGVGFNHCLIDGIGSGDFLNSFAELARHHGAGAGGRADIKPWPIWDRHLVDSIIDSNETSPEEGTLSRVLDISGIAYRFSSERLVPTAAVFDKASIDDLKKTASAGGTITCKFTSFEALSAHVWRSWARSLNLPPNQTLRLVFSVNIRNRVNPGFPEGYYGNAFVLASVQSNVRDLTEKGLAHVAKLVKQAKDEIGPGYIRSIIDSVKEGTAGADHAGTLVISQWSMLGLDRVDFGLGRPIHVAPICCDKYCLVLPRSGDGRGDGVKVMVALPETAVDKYVRLIKRTSCP